MWSGASGALSCSAATTGQGREGGRKGLMARRERGGELRKCIHVHILWTMKRIEGREVYGGREKGRDR